MNRIKRAAIPLVCHLTVFLLLYLWEAKGIAGAGNVLAVLGVLMFVGALGLILASDEATKTPAPAAPLPFGLAKLFLWGEVAALIWFGRWLIVVGFGLFGLATLTTERKRRECQKAARPPVEAQRPA